jgi:hypothetical protein
MFAALQKLMPIDKDYPARVLWLDTMRRVLDGTIYDLLANEFHEEQTEAGEYIPLQNRRPSVRSNLCAVVVRDSVSLLFGEGRFPVLHSDDEDTRRAMADLVKATKLNAIMIDAATRGSIGSVAVRFRILKDRPFYDVMDTMFLTLVYDPEAPDTLKSVRYAIKVKRKDLISQGYTLPGNGAHDAFWFAMEWTADTETWFIPQPIAEYRKGVAPQIDTARTVQHRLGFVPIAWIKNLQGGADPDGACTFAPAIDTVVDIDYQLSQAGRGLRYASDPKLVIKGGVPEDGVKGGAARTLSLDAENGDAKLLEINGTAAHAVVEYVKTLREMALEALRGNRSNADKLSAAQSGRAMEMLHQPLIWLADDLRVSYGEGALIELVNMAVKASKLYSVTVNGKVLSFDATKPISLQWRHWFPATYTDKQTEAVAVSTLRTAGVVSRQRAVQIIAPNYDIEDVAGEITKIEADIAADDARLAKQAAQIQVKETLAA